ncbi:MAG: RNA polymerase subunit sigma-70 [Myxococcaceae bacterium]|nr:RNA polymerase subunit sigma-70 [Myxococcaceae bacterium]MCI0671123.1 RNA polymerase subunit sigma-70 [Myxococcaceae bacterium]
MFSAIFARRAAGEPVGALLGELCERWRRPAAYVIGKVQASYGRGASADVDELYQDAVGKLLDRGLEQFRGLSERHPGRAASPRTFFLRIVKHVTIDFYRRQREDLVDTATEGAAAEEPPGNAARSMARAHQLEAARDARDVYRAAFRRLTQEHPKEAAAWDLYHHEDVEDHEECARRLNISVVNSYKRVSRAQAYLKAYLLELRDRGEL